MSQNYSWPGTITASNPSVGINGAAIPTSATLVGGSDGTDLRPLSTNSSGVLNVSPAANSSVNLTQVAGAAISEGQKTMANSLPVVIASDQAAVPASQSGAWTVQPGNTVNTTAWLVNNASKVQANAPVFNLNSSVNITTAAYVQLVASTTSACSAVECWNQTGSSIYFATGAALSEVNQFVIPPGGNGYVPLKIAASTRISVKAVDANATTGSLIVNFWS